MYNQIKYIIKVKEVNNPKIIETSYTTNHEVTEEFLVEFFGLNLLDVQSYEIEKQYV